MSLALALSVLAAVAAGAQQNTRVATYNIKFLSSGVQSQGDRLTKLREVIDLLDADVIGLQEIDNRAALELLFPPQDWSILIDDDSRNNQDVAIVVRRPFNSSASTQRRTQTTSICSAGLDHQGILHDAAQFS